jgi:hypothetical protein
VTDLKTTFAPQIDTRPPEFDLPLVTTGAPKLRHSFFAWYEPEERPPTVEPVPTVPPTTTQSTWRQMCFLWYDEPLDED